MFKEKPNHQWRALAVSENGDEIHLCLGNSIREVKNGIASPWYNYLDMGVRKEINEIQLQKWHGTENKGRWITKYRLDELLPVDIKDFRD